MPLNSLLFKRVSEYDGIWVTGECSGAGRVNVASARGGGVNGGGGSGETGISGTDGENGEMGESAHVIGGIVWSSCLPIISS